MKERASVLWLLLVVSLVAAVASYGALFAAISHARRTKFNRTRTAARYAAEAGLVWAMERLWQDPSWTPPGGTPTLTINGIGVIVTMPNCTQTPCEPRTLQARVPN